MKSLSPSPLSHQGVVTQVLFKGIFRPVDVCFVASQGTCCNATFFSLAQFASTQQNYKAYQYVFMQVTYE